MSLPPKAQVRAASDRTQRPRNRKAFNGTAQKLMVPYTIEGYDCRWVNDYPGRVLEFQMNGYDFVKPEEVGLPNNVSADTNSERVSKVVNHFNDGTSNLAYLMKIPHEWALENRQDIQDRVDEIDKAIRSGKISPVESSYGADQIKYTT